MDNVELVPVLDDLAEALNYAAEDRSQRLQLLIPQRWKCRGELTIFAAFGTNASSMLTARTNLKRLCAPPIFR
jgi:hypothetical protein